MDKRGALTLFGAVNGKRLFRIHPSHIRRSDWGHSGGGFRDQSLVLIVTNLLSHVTKTLLPNPSAALPLLYLNV